MNRHLGTPHYCIMKDAGSVCVFVLVWLYVCTPERFTDKTSMIKEGEYDFSHGGYYEIRSRQ